VSPMVQLREWTLGRDYKWPASWDSDFAELDSILAALPALTCLTLPDADGMPQEPPGGYLSNGFAGLHKLSLSLPPEFPEVLLHLRTVLTKLEELRVYGNCHLLLSRLDPVPHLTKLEAGRRANGVTLYVSGNVLARFQSLQQLHLSSVLDVTCWDEDMRSLTVLTDLRVLVIDRGNTLWEVTSRELMPLTAFKRLWNLELFPILVSKDDVSQFWRAIKDIRYEMGFSTRVPSHKKNRLTCVF
jgi:hypothetical protein